MLAGIELKSDCQLRIKKYVCKESYKLAPFLISPKKHLQCTRATNKLGAKLKGGLHLGVGEINKKTAK